jgi:hypothetical protein
MKQIILFCLIFSFGLTVQAQINVAPNDLSQDTLLNLLDQFISTKIDTEIHNDTNEDAELYWEIVQISGPTNWEVQLCVNNESGGCFSWGVPSNVYPAGNIDKPLLIVSNEASIFDLGVRPYGTPGVGVFEIRVAPYGDSLNIIAVGNFQFTIDGDGTTSTENFDKSLVKIFPNPTADYFTITENTYVESIQIFNIVGKQMAATNFQNGDAINISSFPNGLYLVRMMDNNGAVLKTTRLTKR